MSNHAVITPSREDYVPLTLFWQEEIMVLIWKIIVPP